MPTLVFRNGPQAGLRVEVGSELLLGREQAQLTLDDPQVSRRHAVVRPVAAGLEIEDLGSLNGTRVNGDRIHGAVRLAPGDRVEIGETLFEVELEGAGSPPTVLSPAAPAAAPAAAPGPAAAPAPGPAAAPAPGPAAAPAPGPAAPPRTLPPFGALAPPVPGRAGRRVASRRLTPTLLAFGTVIVTAIALVAYFASR